VGDVEEQSPSDKRNARQYTIAGSSDVEKRTIPCVWWGRRKTSTFVNETIRIKIVRVISLCEALSQGMSEKLQGITHVDSPITIHAPEKQ